MTKRNTRLAPGEPTPGGKTAQRSKIKQFVDDEVLGNGTMRPIPNSAA